MAADNHTTIVGNLVDDPELRFTNNGIAVANLRVAVTQRIQQDGEWRDGDTSFFKVNVWRGQAENLADFLTKGDRVMVTGRLRQRSRIGYVADRGGLRNSCIAAVRRSSSSVPSSSVMTIAVLAGPSTWLMVSARWRRGVGGHLRRARWPSGRVVRRRATPAAELRWAC